MRLIALLFLLPNVSAFVPHHGAATRSTLLTRPVTYPSIPEVDVVNDITGKVSGALETVLEKADDIVFSRVMRLVNHAPAIATLSTLLGAVGSTRFGTDIAPGALSFITPAGLAVPTWVGYSIPIVVLSQAVAVIRSTLDDSNELSQGDVAAMAISNWGLTRALSNASPMNWAIAAIASNYIGRNGGSEDPSINNISTQVASSVSTAAAVLGATSVLPSIISSIIGHPIPDLTTPLIGLVGLIGLSNSGNGKVKKLVNAAVIGGIAVKKIIGGGFSVGPGLLFTAATAYVAAMAINKAVDAL